MILCRFLVVLFISTTLAGFTLSCKSSKPGSKPRKSQYKRSTYDVKIKSIDDIQYKGAYKYDTDGKKNKKHYRKKKRREN